jgi:hypothetical protein
MIKYSIIEPHSFEILQIINEKHNFSSVRKRQTRKSIKYNYFVFINLTSATLEKIKFFIHTSFLQVSTEFFYSKNIYF